MAKKASSLIVLHDAAHIQERKFQGRVRRADEMDKKDPKVMTGIFPLDWAAGGGLLTYKTNVFWGEESAEKTTGALTAAASALRTCWRCFKPFLLCDCGKKRREAYAYLIDAEYSFDPAWAERLGVPLDRIYHAEPTTGEEGLRMVDHALSIREVRFIIIDSLANLFPTEALMKDPEESVMGKHAQLMGKLWTRVTKFLSKRRQANEPFVLLATNQVRTDFKVQFGDNKIMPGGWAVKHGPRIIFELRKKTIPSEEKARYFDEDNNFLRAHRISVKLTKAQSNTLSGVAEYVRVKAPIREIGLRDGDIDHYRLIMKRAIEKGIVVESKGGKWAYTNGAEKVCADAMTQKEMIRRWKRNHNESLAIQYLTIQAAMMEIYPDVVKV